jgi:hypothetical protein
MTRPHGWPTALAGGLAYVGLTSLLVLLEMERRTGVLELRQRRRTGLLGLREGRVVHASVDGRPLPGCEAVSELIGWTTGRFAFRIGEVDGTGEPPRPTTQLLLEVARRADERGLLG